MFVITVDVCNIPLLKLRYGYMWMMMEFKRMGYCTGNLCRVNNVRVHQQVLFFSDVLGASGKSLDRNYFKQRGVEEQWSTHARMVQKYMGEN